MGGEETNLHVPSLVRNSHELVGVIIVVGIVTVNFVLGKREYGLALKAGVEGIVALNVDLVAVCVRVLQPSLSSAISS